jgi:hypothetical protein
VPNPGQEINTHFATSPFHEAEIKAGLRTITSGFDIMGGPTTGVTFTSHDKFRAENPKAFAAVMRAFAGSFEWINADKRRTARLYVEMTKEKKLTEDELTESFSGRDMEYTNVPSRVGQLVDFLYRTGSVKAKALSGGTCSSPKRTSFRGAERSRAGPLPQAAKPLGGGGCKDGQSAEIGRADRHRRLKARPVPMLLNGPHRLARSADDEAVDDRGGRQN